MNHLQGLHSLQAQITISDTQLCMISKTLPNSFMSISLGALLFMQKVHSPRHLQTVHILRPQSTTFSEDVPLVKFMYPVLIALPGGGVIVGDSGLSVLVVLCACSVCDVNCWSAINLLPFVGSQSCQIWKGK